MKKITNFFDWVVDNPAILLSILGVFVLYWIFIEIKRIILENVSLDSYDKYYNVKKHFIMNLYINVIPSVIWILFMLTIYVLDQNNIIKSITSRNCYLWAIGIFMIYSAISFKLNGGDFDCGFRSLFRPYKFDDEKKEIVEYDNSLNEEYKKDKDEGGKRLFGLIISFFQFIFRIILFVIVLVLSAIKCISAGIPMIIFYLILLVRCKKNSKYQISD